MDRAIIGRTDSALQIPPKALQQTGRIINLGFSHLVDGPQDIQDACGQASRPQRQKKDLP